MIRLILICLVLFLNSCEKGCTDPNAANYNSNAKKDNGSCYYLNPPTNLNFTIQNEQNSRLVTVEASATNENYFTTTFFENNEETTVQSVDGFAMYTYSDTGWQKIRVRAHLNATSYIEQLDSVNLSFGQIVDIGYQSPQSYPGLQNVWSDEFNDSVIGDDWTFEIGTGSNGWGNNELQYYREENTRLDNGYLIITAKQENYGGRQYTSSRIITENKQQFQYGRIDARIKLPYSQGIWPAFWMLGQNFRQVGWPYCGEIDVMEMIGGQLGDRQVFGTLHWYDNGYASYGGNKTWPTPLHQEFHVFSIVWDQQQIRWYIDNQQYHQQDISQIPAFQLPHFFIINIAVGGNWPGSPNGQTQLPQQMAIDYIRVFE